MKMTMNNKDRQKYNMLSDFINKWQNKKIIEATLNELTEMPPTLAEKQIAALYERTEALEKLIVFMLINEAGEIGLTPELKEVMKETGFWKLYVEFERVMKGVQHGKT